MTSLHPLYLHHQMHHYVQQSQLVQFLLSMSTSLISWSAIILLLIFCIYAFALLPIRKTASSDILGRHTSQARPNMNAAPEPPIVMRPGEFDVVLILDNREIRGRTVCVILHCVHKTFVTFLLLIFVSFCKYTNRIEATFSKNCKSVGSPVPFDPSN